MIYGFFVSSIVGTYLHELSVIVSISGFSPIPKTWIFPVQIQPVKVVLSQKLNGIFDQFFSSFGVGDHGRESGRALVPSPNGQHGLQIFIVGLQSSEFCVTTFEIGKSDLLLQREY